MAKPKKKPDPKHHGPQRRSINRLLASRERKLVRKGATQPGHVGEATIPTPQALVRDLVDKFAGANSERVIHALAVIALGNATSRVGFFGEAIKVQTKDRIQALQQLGMRRWGRPGITVELAPGDPSTLPVQIVNIFTADTNAEDGDQ